MGVLTQIGQLLLSLSILVLLHEFGHFIVAKYFKTRVEKFYLFFNPWFSLFKIKKGETEYGIGWVPLGGYVKIAGMIDESMDKEQLKRPPQAYEFRSKPTWQRLIIILAGVIVNFLLALFIYSTILYLCGEKYLPPEKAKYGIDCDSLVLNIGLQNGDKILMLDNKKVERFTRIIPDIILYAPKTIQFERNGEMKNVEIPESFTEELLKKSSRSFKREPLILPRVLFQPFIISKLDKKYPAYGAGMLRNDKIISIDRIKFEYYDEFADYLQSHKNQNINVVVEREGIEKSFDIQLDEKGLLGVNVKARDDDFEYSYKTYGFFEAIPAGINLGYTTLTEYISSMRLLFTTKSGYKSLGGFGTITSIFSKTWDWQSFWRLTAFLSIMLAFINVLPIPALDGGHAVFIIIEMVTGKKPGEKTMEIAQIIGFVLLLGLIIFANGNDILKLFSK